MLSKTARMLFIVTVAAALFALSRAALANPKEETHVVGSPDFVTALARDIAGNIWIGSEAEGVACLSPAGDITTYTTENGLGDNGAYCIVQDSRGRIWIGHHNTGVSVFNGKSWKHYSSGAGPIGDHIYAMAVHPLDGDVWICTDAGISRYSQAEDTWSHLTRAEGLPEDQARGIAFDSDGDVYIATATKGLAIGRVSEKYSKFETVTGPDEMPMTVRGKSLPTNLTNAVCITKNNTIWVATTRGLACSSDKGKTFKYTRGKDWIDLVNGSYSGSPPNWQPKGETILTEDWCTTLATDVTGDLWVGYRTKGWQRLDVSNWPVGAKHTATDDAPPEGRIDEVTAILANTGKTAYIARYGEGLFRADMAAGAIIEPRDGIFPHHQPQFPRTAAALDEDQVAKLTANIRTLKKAGPIAAYLGEDWVTQGDWIGRYGRQFASLSGLGWGPRNYGNMPGFTVDYSVGPHFPNAGVYSYIFEYKSKSSSALWDPMKNSRTQGEHNDGSFDRKAYPLTVEGPDLWVAVTVPEGVFRVSLYFYNVDGHKLDNAWRDFPLELRREGDAPAAGQNQNPVDDDNVIVPDNRNDGLFALEKLPILAKGRVTRFTGGVYEQFIVSGKGKYWIKIVRNHGFCTKIQGVFVDQLSPAPNEDGVNKPFFAGVEIPVAQIPEIKANAPMQERAARELWQVLDSSWDKAGIENISRAYRLAAFRAAQNADATADLFAAWRWNLHMWTQSDRDEFAAQMTDGWARFKTQNPNVKDPE